MNDKRIFDIKMYFDENCLASPEIQLVANDYNSVEFYFTFDREGKRKLFKLKRPDGTPWVKEIIDNKIVLVDTNENGDLVPVINQSGKYEYEACLYDDNSRLTAHAFGEFRARDEIVSVDDETVFNDSNLPFLEQLIKQVDNVIKNTNESSENANTQANYAKELGDYAKEQGDYAKNTADNVINEKKLGLFNGKSLEFIWQGTQLGIRQSGDTEYQFTDLQGIQGIQGDTGEPFKIKKTYPSVQAMYDDFDNMNFNDYVMIASGIEEEDNAKMYTRGEKEWIFITDFSGAIGIRGETGLTPNIKIGSVTTLNPDENASVTRKGTNEQPIFDFGIPKGEKGDTYVLQESDKQEIIDNITSNANSKFNQNVNTKTNEFNDNVNLKMEAYNGAIENAIDEFIPKNILEGESVHIKDALNHKVFNLEVEGNFKQETTNEYPTSSNTKKVEMIENNLNLIICNKNLYNYNDISRIDEGYTIKEAGWITFSYTNNTANTLYPGLYTNPNKILKKSTDYNVICEIKEISGSENCGFSIVSDSASFLPSEFSTTFTYRSISSLNSDMIVNQICRTKENFDTSLSMLRTLITVPAGATCNITFRISVIEDLTVSKDNFIYKSYEKLSIPIDLKGNFLGKLSNGVADSLIVDKNSNVKLLKNISKTMSENNTEIYSQLVEPQIIDLGSLEEPLKTFEEDNYFYIESNLEPSSIKVEYALDIKKYTDDKLTEITNALISTSANI